MLYREKENACGPHGLGVRALKGVLFLAFASGCGDDDLSGAKVAGVTSGLSSEFNASSVPNSNLTSEDPDFTTVSNVSDDSATTSQTSSESDTSSEKPETSADPSSSSDSTTANSTTANSTTANSTTADSTTATSETPSNGSTGEGSTTSSAEQECLGSQNVENNEESKATSIGAISVGDSSVWDGALHLIDSCDSVDYYSFFLYGSISKVRFEAELRGDADIDLELREGDGPYQMLHRFEAKDPRPHELVIPRGSFNLRLTPSSTTVESRSEYNLKVLVPDSSNAVVDPDVGKTWMKPLLKGDIFDMDYAKPTGEGFVGDNSGSDFYSFTADKEGEGLIGVYSKFGDPEIVVSRLMIKDGKMAPEKLAGVNVLPGKLLQMSVSLDPSVTTVYIIEVKKGEAYGADYRIYLGTELKEIDI